MIIYGVEELITNNRIERFEHDKEHVMFKAETCESEVEEGDIVKIVILGKFNKDEDKPKRPMLVAFKDQKTKVGYFKGGSKLRESETHKETRISNGTGE